ncbi:hypothetical protein U879_10035 [Defluviimonas sp. 20V17]|uniref:Uncharacterized protein n=1 Tax=Allgaiera indica TaxID=765699 RepID=A0AAN4UPN1_9RHOB|nr:DUF6476 family protein [Allgaiera indica]KDB03827.1 hypothetical protein U879_10035 [Defluviimonas sp. 20V17]GHE00068.1 hypothetical protein GCM10008024_10300 [Allgaiera indica]SDW37787.1 hypothetical protein SAMN05444006_10362 [Allgaiera indica]
MNDAPAPGEGLPPSLRLLKGLVIVLMITMIAGLIAIVALLVIRVPKSGGDLVVPAALKLPAGARAEAITQGRGWIAVVTTAGKILVFDGTTGKLRHSYDVN